MRAICLEIPANTLGGSIEPSSHHRSQTAGCLVAQWIHREFLQVVENRRIKTLKGVPYLHPIRYPASRMKPPVLPTITSPLDSLPKDMAR